MTALEWVVFRQRAENRRTQMRASPKLLSRSALSAFFSLQLASPSFAQTTLPTTQEFNSALATCAAGIDITITADLLGSITSLYNGERTKGAANFRTATKFLELFPVNDRVKAYELYTRCITEIIPINGQFAYLNNVYVNKGLMDGGWGYGAPEKLIAGQKEPLMVYPSASEYDVISFIVSSAATSSIKVDRMFLKLHSYADCNLRNETKRSTGGGLIGTAKFYLSKDYNVYPIKPLTENLVLASWVYKGKDLDEFRVSFDFDTYVLYLVSVNVDYLDLNKGTRKHIESDEFSLIKVKNGNVGGLFRH
jgi:hypothetical protein